MKPDTHSDEAVADAAKRFCVFAGRLEQAGMPPEVVIDGMLAATVSIASTNVDPARRKEFAKWLRRWATAVERGKFNPEAFDA